jgi:hypothetical protein
MDQTTPEQNKAVILEVVTTAVNHRDFAALDTYGHPRLRAVKPHDSRGRAGVRGFWASLPDVARYGPAAIIAERDLVMVARPILWRDRQTAAACGHLPVPRRPDPGKACRARGDAHARRLTRTRGEGPH